MKYLHFVTTPVIRAALAICDGAMEKSTHLEIRSKRMATVVLVPSLKTDRLKWPQYTVVPHIAYTGRRGPGVSKSLNQHSEIAQCLALQLWHNRNAGTGHVTPAHLLFEDDTPCGGGVSRDGIVVACSGPDIKPHFCYLVSGIISDSIVALAHEAWEGSDEKRTGKKFL